MSSRAKNISKCSNWAWRMALVKSLLLLWTTTVSAQSCSGTVTVLANCTTENDVSGCINLSPGCIWSYDWGGYCTTSTCEYLTGWGSDTCIEYGCTWNTATASEESSAGSFVNTAAGSSTSSNTASSNNNNNNNGEDEDPSVVAIVFVVIFLIAIKAAMCIVQRRQINRKKQEMEQQQMYHLNQQQHQQQQLQQQQLVQSTIPMVDANRMGVNHGIPIAEPPIVMADNTDDVEMGSEKNSEFSQPVSITLSEQIEQQPDGRLIKVITEETLYPDGVKKIAVRNEFL